MPSRRVATIPAFHSPLPCQGVSEIHRGHFFGRWLGHYRILNNVVTSLHSRYSWTLSMPFLVQKYGGTSVGNPERIRNVATRVAAAHKAGHRLVVVVSAMSGVTDRLIKLAREVTPEPSTRELDMLLSTGEQQTIALTAMALHALDVPAVSLTGAQAGI